MKKKQKYKLFDYNDNIKSSKHKNENYSKSKENNIMAMAQQ